MLESFLGKNLMPHGYCFQWRSDILYMTVIGDILTVISYSLIPIALIYLVKKRDDLSFNRIFYLFAAFIAFCGLTHLMTTINIWQPNYFISSIIKLITGIVSIITAYTLWELMPKFLAIPSNANLRIQNEKLRNAQIQAENAKANLEQTVKDRTKKLERLANTDQLTQVNNRRSILKLLEHEIKRYKRHPKDLSLLMLDLDHFKKINDEYGHLEGDLVLAESAKTIVQTCRETDFVGRYGGEEFLIVMPETEKEEATKLAERVRKNIASTFKDKYKITCSIGIASYKSEETSMDFIKKADNRTYKAKKGGRNLVVSS